MLTTASRMDVMNRLGRAMADPTRSRVLLSLLSEPGYPAQLARDLNLSRTNVSNHLACLRGCGIVVAAPEGRRTRYEISDSHLTRALEALLCAVLAVDDGAPCADEHCDVPLCCGPGAAVPRGTAVPATPTSRLGDVVAPTAADAPTGAVVARTADAAAGAAR